MSRTFYLSQNIVSARQSLACGGAEGRFSDIHFRLFEVFHVSLENSDLFSIQTVKVIWAAINCAENFAVVSLVLA